MNRIIISIGSNNNKYQNISLLKVLLRNYIYGPITYSDYLITTPYGNRYKESFLNQLALFHTELPLKQLILLLKDIENTLGRTKSKSEKGIVDIDIDVILYNNQKLKLEDWERTYVKDLLSNLRSKCLLRL